MVKDKTIKYPFRLLLMNLLTPIKYTLKKFFAQLAVRTTVSQLSTSQNPALRLEFCKLRLSSVRGI